MFEAPRPSTGVGDRVLGLKGAADARPGAPDSQPPEIGAGDSYRWVILVLTVLILAASSSIQQAIGPLAPFFQAGFGMSRAEVGLLSSAIFGGALIASGWGGGLTDRFGVRRVFAAGLICLAVFTALAALAQTVWLLFPLLFLAGLGNGISSPTTTRAIVFWFPRRIRGIAIGIKQTGLTVAGAAAALILPAIALTWGWQGGLIAVAAGTAAITLLGCLAYREAPAERIGSSEGSAGSIDVIDLFRDRAFLLICSVSFLYAAAQLATLNFAVLYFREERGLSLIAAGGFLSLAQVGGFVGRIGWGFVSDLAFGGRRKLVLGIIGAGAGGSFLLLARLPAEAPAWLAGLAMIVFGLSSNSWTGIATAFVAEIAGRDRSATAAGLNLTACYLGIMVGPPAFGWIVDQTRSYGLGFAILAGVMLVAVGVLSRVREQGVGRGE